MKIICIGRNYAAHIEELKNEKPDAPVLFMKPATALLPQGKDFYIPDFSKEIHYEAELVFRICRNGKYISEKYASDFYDAVSVGIDFTARDIQEQQKKKGLPWEISKSFDNSAVVGRMIPLDNGRKKEVLEFSFHNQNEILQKGSSAQMIYNIDQIIAYASRFFSLNINDLIFTGTPKGVGPVAIGHSYIGKIFDETVLYCNIR